MELAELIRARAPCARLRVATSRRTSLTVFSSGQPGPLRGNLQAYEISSDITHPRAALARAAEQSFIAQRRSSSCLCQHKADRAQVWIARPRVIRACRMRRLQATHAMLPRRTRDLEQCGLAH